MAGMEAERGDKQLNGHTLLYKACAATACRDTREKPFVKVAASRKSTDSADDRSSDWLRGKSP
jgi:hypothetical protein